MAELERKRWEDWAPWATAIAFYIGGVAMTFLGVPLAILMGIAMILGLPVAYAWHWAEERRRKRLLRADMSGPAHGLR